MEKKLCLVSIGVLLVFAIVFTVVLPSLTPSEETEIQNSLKETDRNLYYGCLLGQLKASFPKVLIQTEYGEQEVIAYPPEYAGAYVDKSDNLHIVLTKKANITTKQDYLEIMDNNEEIIFDIGDFSLSHLYELQRTLGGVMQEFSIEFIGLNETANRLDIGLHDRTKENEIKEFLKNEFNDFDARCLTFNGSLGIKLTS
ncbi:MAG: hypothetical protein IAX21_03685 [Candidatus Bathyarchaeota archaeon]|nr:hypothetical protein [Candidatus Bathyarchaeum tardum]WGM89885.1 MAG: hypothetical protein NUK63_01830 [Candidatus Bathyarchaeum tardum]WNZ29969.1 MAG: hypothetical protein IAX21_03685 [Candidatus Bathyarchaeota archaeon]